MGWVTPLGHEIAPVWERLVRGESAIGPVTRFEADSFKTCYAAEVRDFDPLYEALEVACDAPAAPPGPGARGARARCLPDLAPGLSSRFALVAAHSAWRMSGLEALAARGGLEARRFGAYLGAGEGVVELEGFAGSNLASWDEASRRTDPVAWARAAYARLAPAREIEQEPNLTLGHVAARLGCRGPTSNCMTACAASTQAVGEAFEIVRSGEADVMVAGGAHSMIHPLGMTGFIRLTAMSRRNTAGAARPFDRSRDGFVMGEGAGMVIVEALEHYLARRNRSRQDRTGEGPAPEPLAEIVGYGSSADAFRITDIQPEGQGAQVAMLQACRQAGINPREPGGDGRPQVHYISAHGTGTEENDKIETAAVKGVFGALAARVPFSSVKSMLGHLIQAAGAVELITCIQAIRTGWVPPTINLAVPDPACDLDYVPNQARDLRAHGGVDVCLSNSFGFGGQNNTIAVRRYRAD